MGYFNWIYSGTQDAIREQIHVENFMSSWCSLLKKNQFWDDDCMLSRGLSADPRHILSFQKKRFIGVLGPGGLDIWDSFMKGIVAFKTISTFSDARTFCCSICTSCGGVIDPTFVSIFSASKHRRLHRQFIGLALLCMLLHTWQLELVLRHSFALAEHLGVPSIVLTPWKAFLQGCTRAFKVRDFLSYATRSTCGMPEGDALSVYAMVQLNFVWHIYQKQFCPNVRACSFVDNLSLLAEYPADLAAGYSTLCAFFELWNLQIDLGKSYCWSLNPSDRANLRRFPMKMVYAWARWLSLFL